MNIVVGIFNTTSRPERESSLPSRCRILLQLLCVVLLFSRSCDGYGPSFGFDMHHRFSDHVMGLFPSSSDDNIPQKGTLDYYRFMVHRDRILHSRRLASTVDQTLLTFSYGNQTIKLNSLGHLYYANVSVGTPSLSFLVALDTGSDLFWLLCDCSSCVTSLKTSSGLQIDFNIYSPNASTTSAEVPCNSTLCAQTSQCSSKQTACAYRVEYLSDNTSTSGYLVEDVLHLTTDDANSKSVDPKITFGCGRVETGSFLTGGAPNGLFGLGIQDISVPSILAKQGLTSNSFSMCFGSDGLGRITFGDKGISGQGETPFNLQQSHSFYNISIARVTVGNAAADVNFTALFDSGTSFTFLSDPVYTFIGDSFNSKVEETRYNTSDTSVPFEYCYVLGQNQTSVFIPKINLTMGSGDSLYIHDPIFLASNQIYCLALLKSGGVNIIGQNYMTGYRIVFDREKMVLGWAPSNCSDSVSISTNTLPISPQISPGAPSPAVNPQATANTSSTSEALSPKSSNSVSLTLNHMTLSIMIVLFSIVIRF